MSVHQNAIEAMVDDAGRLTGVHHVRAEFGDVPGWVSAVVLDFEHGSWTLSVDPDDDTVRIDAGRIARREHESVGPAPAGSPWRQALGMSAQWIWLLRNQRGYEDGIQFAFVGDRREPCTVQMVAMASRWQIGLVRSD
ncbi:DUF6334 family protein [Streptacidiphilus rugosus]|uniref:DUF6334 family protein n=1 Tax=Streptacidiphilus rugosus TaxID=405783 RepID=UPI000561A8BE|nr:DUF6334 family protein [Streptacidiphilus rugosus]